jgi:hypothetical protein
MTVGIGGAGLFSDGKFSFFPSSTELWTTLQLHPRALTAAYNNMSKCLSDLGMEVPSIPPLVDHTDTKVPDCMEDCITTR